METIEYIAGQSLGSLVFGMSSTDIISKVGAPTRVVDSSFNLGSKTTYYPSLSLVFDYDKLVEINVIPAEIGIEFRGEVISGSSKTVDIVKFLNEHSKDSIEQVGFLIFKELGIAISGIQDNDSSQENISLFVKGRWDKWLK